MNRNRLAWWIAALALAGVPLLGGCKESTATADEAAALQAEATAPATPENPLLAMAQVEPGADGQAPRLTLYGLTLDAPLPGYPACTDDMIWHRDAPGPCFLPNDKYSGEQRPVFDLIGELGGVFYPRKMMNDGYTDAVTVGFDVQGVQYMRVLTDGGLDIQHHYVELMNKLLGQPVLMIQKEGETDAINRNPPDGVPLMMWAQAGDGAMVVIWETDYAWGRYIGGYVGESRGGYLEIGSKRILQNGQLPDW